MTIDATNSIFGRIVAGSDVEGWCMDLVKRWFSTYLAEVERQHGLDAGSWQRPRGYVVAPSFDKWPEDQVPAILLVSTGLAEKPPRGGDGRYRPRWIVGIGALCSARTQAESHAMAMAYGAALYALFVQRPSLDGMADGTDWIGYDVEDALAYDDLRSLAMGIAHFTVEVDDAVTANAGPLEPDAPLQPDTDPWPPWATAGEVDTTVTSVPLEDPLPTEGG